MLLFHLYGLEEIREKQTFYDETYGGLSNPEWYWKYMERTEELETVKAEYQTILDYMVQHYKEMDAEPLFSFQGTLGTGDVYHQQAKDAEDAAIQYRNKIGNLPDPTELHRLLFEAARMNKTLEGYDWAQAEEAVWRVNNPTEADKALDQILRGNYSEYVTPAGTAGQIGLGLLGLDLPADIRDLTYDLTHLRSTPWWQTGSDLLSVLPIVGGIKYVDEAATLAKGGNRTAAAVEGVADATKAANRTNAIAEAGTVSGKFDGAESWDYNANSRTEALRERGWNRHPASEVYLPKQEYAHVMSEIATHMTETQNAMAVFKVFIGDSVYLVKNNGFGNYTILKKMPNITGTFLD